jgi:hypothetical protein
MHSISTYRTSLAAPHTFRHRFDRSCRLSQSQHSTHTRIRSSERKGTTHVRPKRQLLDRDTRPRGLRVLHNLTPHVVHSCKILHRGQKNGRFHHVLNTRASLLEHCLDVGEDLSGMVTHTNANGLHGGVVEADVAGDVDLVDWGRPQSVQRLESR